MNRFGAVPALALLLLLGATPGALAGQGSALATALQVTVLENGLQVVVVEDHSVPLATVLVVVRGGAFAQDSGDDGLAHLFEHMLFRSYEGNPARFGEQATSLEGGYNGGTSSESNSYYLEVPSSNVDKAIGIIGDLVRNVRFTKAELALERPIVLDEIQRDHGNPESALALQVEQGLWGSAWPWKDALGDSASLERLDAGALQTAFGRYYVPNNSALIVTGDVSAEDVFTRARRELGGWRAGADPLEDRARRVAPRLERGPIAIRSDNVRDVTIWVELVGPAVATDTSATYAADVLTDVLNDPASAFQRRLVKFGPFQSIQASYYTQAHGGPITFRGTLSPERAEEGILLLFGEIDLLDRLDGVTDWDLQVARRHRNVGEAMAMDGVDALAFRLAFWWSTTGLEYLEERPMHLERVTLEDLRRFAASYVVGRARSVGILAPPETAERIGVWMRKAFGR